MCPVPNGEETRRHRRALDTGVGGDGAALRATRDAEDGWLVRQARAGSAEAFEVLITRHQDRIFRIALRVLGNRHDAEDVMQDVLIQLWTGLAGFAGTSAFTTWLHRVVVNRCLSRARSVRRTETVPGPSEAGHPTTPAAGRQVQDQAELAVAAHAVAGLPDDQRSVFVLCQLEGLSYREVAVILRLPETTVRGRLARARERLAQAMEEWA
ncbi:RNA polymerase sigma-70 factor (ECF subfamily) [Actinomycetospora succinea]|uniref:RNA polymerase sigma-70 factor (ECF subfamily) n=1 Tax=Actinomycetospora succinea TaxID=663603 RepID=A0A4R6UJT0_9PSEU|nr:RNA polymerase sigma factor [Actinomycetospora succinea]TDQ46376.1 RNA polymerase sigma-70 factor (ECF subfamily) [Actinomycetospora succinea]